MCTGIVELQFFNDTHHVGLLRRKRQLGQFAVQLQPDSGKLEIANVSQTATKRQFTFKRPASLRGGFFMEKTMTKLPEKSLLDGSKTPKTSTREMKPALGELRDYLSALLGTDSDDKAAAREALGIDLSMSPADIIDALGYTPYDAANPDRFRTVPEVVTITGTVPENGGSGQSVVVVEENRVYQLGEVKKVIVTSLPDGHLESSIYFSTGNTPVEIDIQTSHKLIGDLTTEANKFYVISVVNRYVVMGEAVGIDG